MESDLVYLEMQQKVRQMKVVNDCAERGIALITTYNSSITKDEDKTVSSSPGRSAQKDVPGGIESNADEPMTFVHARHLAVAAVG